MTRSFLIATVAALAITAPATAQDRGGEARQQRQAQRAQAQQQRAERPQQQRVERQAPQQRMERQAPQQRMERQAQQRPQFQQREARQQPDFGAQRQQMRERRNAFADRQQMQERSAQRQQMQERRNVFAQRQDRSAQRQERSAQRQQMQERRNVFAQRQERSAERREAADRGNLFAQRQERAAQRARMEGRGGAFAREGQRISRRDQRLAELNQDRGQRFDGLSRQAFDRRGEFREQRLESAARQNIFDRRAAQYDREQGNFRPAYDQNATVRYTSAQRDGLWQAMAERAQFIRSRDRVRTPNRTLAMVGAPLDTRYYYDDYVPLGYRSMYYDTPDYYYRYDDDYGYLYRVRRSNNLVSTLIPLYGGAFSLGQPMPVSYRTYNVPLAYQPYYYDTPDYYYRYGGGAIYQVDAGTQLISAVVALLAGQSLGVGQLLPSNYSVYNVPYAYRSQYYDTPNNWYRYNDGVIYGVDPRTRLIQSAMPMYDDYYIGNPMPATWADYNVPMAYRDVYYDSPEWDYRYADGAIYQVDPQSQVVRALVALVTGNNYAMGQTLPASYGVYNVPVDYRDQYYDTDQYAYRYDDGYVYRIDPRTRVINGMYDVVVA